MTATIQYEGNLRCHAVHLQSGSQIETDAPTDNKGKGERFSPTDLVCTALATCMITTMAIKVGETIDLKGTTVSVKKYMAADPRRITKIDVKVLYPASLQLEQKDWDNLRTIGDNCPVMKSIHPDIVVNAVYSRG
ncbi:MAG: OsmC family protein [Bacteroidota bacterium]